MCIAIFNKSALLSYDIIRNSFENNNDGAGLLWIENGALQVFKESENLKKFWKKYKAIRENNALPIVLHFRIGTHGHFADYNLHPFLVNQNIGFVHNGVIRISEIDARYSDTNHFNRLVLQTMKNPARIFKDGTNEAALVSHFCSTNSKLIFLDSAGQFRIFNEAAGHWDKFGNWFSNNTYKPSAYRDFGGKKIAKTGADFYGGRYTGYLSADYYDFHKKPASQPATKTRGNVPPAIAALTDSKPAKPTKYGAYGEMIDAAENWAKDKTDDRREIITAKPAAPVTPAKTYAPDYRAECLALLGYGVNDLGADKALADALSDYDAHNCATLYAAMLYK